MTIVLDNMTEEEYIILQRDTYTYRKRGKKLWKK